MPVMKRFHHRFIGRDRGADLSLLVPMRSWPVKWVHLSGAARSRSGSEVSRMHRFQFRTNHIGGVAVLALASALAFRGSASAQAKPAPAAAKPAPAFKPPAPTAEQLAIQAATEKDYANMKEQLGIKYLRPGVDGYGHGPDAVNYDESKADMNLPIPNALRLEDGKPVTTAKMWWTERRPQIVALFNEDIYGRVPANVPKVHWQVVSVTHEMNGDVPVITKKLIGHVDNSTDPAITVNIELTLSTPANAHGPVPVIMEFGLDPKFLAMLMKRFPQFKPPPGPSWQQQVLARGWGYAEYIPTSAQADNGAGLTKGIIGLCNHGQRRTPDQWGALRAWAWGASRALDYFETDPAVNAREVGIEGHSRYGKAALVAMAYDQRFAIGYISSSGEAGAKLYRRNFGEQIGNIAASSEYHWMAGNFLKYDGPLTVADLPVDANELIALCAPRPIFISAGTVKHGDGWVDAKGMFLAEAAASPVYRLLGKKGLGATVFPPTGTTLISGGLGFRQHFDGHSPAPNWPTFLDFASRFLHAAAAKPR